MRNSKSKCQYCLVNKLGIIVHTCRCGYNKLCTKCRMPENHDCKHNYINEQKLILEKNNPKIIATKVVII